VIATPDVLRVLMTKFSDQMVPELVQTFWAAMARGEFITGAAAEAGTYRQKGRGWLAAAAGGVRPRRGRDLKGRCLSFGEREDIAVGLAAGQSLRVIAARLGRSPSTVSRELARNADPRRGYRASTAHALAYDRASRPKPAKLVVNLALRAKVEKDLEKKYSPEQITGRLRVEFPNDPEMRVSPETIYQSLYVQSRGALRRDLTERVLADAADGDVEASVERFAATHDHGIARLERLMEALRAERAPDLAAATVAVRQARAALS